MVKYTYIAVDLLTIFLPLAFSFHPKILFFKEWRFFFLSNLLISALFVLWDAIYTSWGVWGFNDKYCLGIKLIGLPIEELLFFLCIPYASLFTYHCTKRFFSNRCGGLVKPCLVVFFFLILVTGGVHMGELYTGVTLVAASLLSLSVIFWFADSWKWVFFKAYLIILVPFFLVNGVLTGSFIAEPVVWYNNSENLGLRIGTIPVEDIFYGLLLLLLNVSLYEFFRHKGQKADTGFSL